MFYRKHDEIINMKDYLKSVVLLTFIVLLALLGLHFLPKISMFGIELKEVDMLADVRVGINQRDLDVDDATVDSTALYSKLDTTNLSLFQDSLEVVAIPADTIKLSAKEDYYLNTKRISRSERVDSLSRIIDYADSTQRGMYPFYMALDNVATKGNYARIAFFGDSFIEADILTADLRNLLQKKYGGRGVGFVPITSEMRFFRRSVKHDFKGWTTHTVTQKGYQKKNLGISGEYFSPTSKSYVEYTGQTKFGTLLDTCNVASLYYTLSDDMYITERVNSANLDSIALFATNKVQRHQYLGEIGKIRWSIPKDSTALFYGASLDGDRGVILDNFGQRGSSGYSLSSIPFKTLSEFNELRPYDLIVLQFGLNVVAKNVKNYDYYKKGLSKVISYLKKCFPHSGFLIVSVGDRNSKGSDGYYHTMPEIKYFIEVQKQIAKENNIAFWNLFDAMGGEDSMVDLVEAKPAKANLDYTHINFIGGKYLGEKLFEAVVQGKTSFDNMEVYVDE